MICFVSNWYTLWIGEVTSANFGFFSPRITVVLEQQAILGEYTWESQMSRLPRQGVSDFPETSYWHLVQRRREAATFGNYFITIELIKWKDHGGRLWNLIREEVIVLFENLELCQGICPPLLSSKDIERKRTSPCPKAGPSFCAALRLHQLENFVGAGQCQDTCGKCHFFRRHFSTSSFSHCQTPTVKCADHSWLGRVMWSERLWLGTYRACGC